MKIISWNVNGLRAMYKRGFLDWLQECGGDVICLQESKAAPDQLSPDLLNPPGFHSYFNSAVKKGYSGVVIYSKKALDCTEYKLGDSRFDSEGRLLLADLGNILILNLYLPHGGRQKENLEYKLEVYNKLISLLETLKDRPVLLVGDFNIAHKEIDLARPRQNQNNIMFTPNERECLERLTLLGFKDSFRMFNQEGGNYTWWPYMAQARERNLGWRLDYIFASAKLANQIKSANILTQILGSDHCPVEVVL